MGRLTSAHLSFRRPLFVSSVKQEEISGTLQQSCFFGKDDICCFGNFLSS